MAFHDTETRLLQIASGLSERCGVQQVLSAYSFALISFSSGSVRHELSRECYSFKVSNSLEIQTIIYIKISIVSPNRDCRHRANKGHTIMRLFYNATTRRDSRAYPSPRMEKRHHHAPCLMPSCLLLVSIMSRIFLHVIALPGLPLLCPNSAPVLPQLVHTST